MGLGDITGVFSRYFVVGFFLPAYISLVALWISASSAFLPNSLERHSEATELLILGGVALVTGLALSGSSYLITRLFEGYPLMKLLPWPLLGLIPRGAIALQRRKFERLLRIRDDERTPDGDRANAAWRLDLYFPQNPDRLLPTRIGNAIRAFESHSNVRWGLDGVTIWPRIEALLSGEERETHVDSKIDLYVFVNAALGAFIVGVCLLVDKARNSPDLTLTWLLYAIPFVVGYVLYRAALPPAINWGGAVRASIDLHRLEVYEKLGLRAPTSFSDERSIAARLNQALLYGNPLLEDGLWRDKTDESDRPRPSGFFARITEWWTRESGEEKAGVRE
jgi:hypothetical protein